MCFINVSNHPSEKWSPEQKAAAEQYGQVIDMNFPAVDPNGSEEYIDRLASDYFEKIRAYDHPVVMVQGEFTFSFALVTKLKAAGYTVLAACSERRVIESTDADGNTEKRSVFAFVQFRKY